MKKVADGFFFALISFVAAFSYAQKPDAATDFTLKDCDGVEHQLFAELESGKVVALVFEMGCEPCIDGRKALADLRDEFELTHPGQVHIYTMGFSSSMKCATVISWMNKNTFVGSCFAGDAATINGYNATTGMPTIVIVGGADHRITYWHQGFPATEPLRTTTIKEMRTAITEVLPAASVDGQKPAHQLSVRPNPANAKVSLLISSDQPEDVSIALYSEAGIKVRDFASSHVLKGSNEITLSTDKLTSGTYYLHILTEGGKAEVVPLIIAR